MRTRRASFVAPAVTSNADPVVPADRGEPVNQADTLDADNREAATVAMSTALALSKVRCGRMRGAATASSVTRRICRQSSRQRNAVRLAARSIAIAKGVDPNDPSAFLDTSRALAG
jgi:hypothetical protein